MISANPGPLFWVLRQSGSSAEEGCCKQVIEDEDQDRGRHDRVGRRLSDPLCASSRIIAVIAAHQRYEKTENRCLYQPRDDVDRLEILMGTVQIGLRIEAEPVDPHQVSAEH